MAGAEGEDEGRSRGQSDNRKRISPRSQLDSYIHFLSVKWFPLTNPPSERPTLIRGGCSFHEADVEEKSVRFEMAAAGWRRPIIIGTVLGYFPSTYMLASILYLLNVRVPGKDSSSRWIEERARGRRQSSRKGGTNGNQEPVYRWSTRTSSPCLAAFFNR